MLLWNMQMKRQGYCSARIEERLRLEDREGNYNGRK